MGEWCMCCISAPHPLRRLLMLLNSSAVPALADHSLILT